MYVPGKDNTVPDCPSRWAYPASKGTTDGSAHGDEAETAEAKRIIEMERLMEEEGVKCFVVMAADAPLGTRMGRAVRVLAPDGAESDKRLSLHSRSGQKFVVVCIPGMQWLGMRSCGHAGWERGYGSLYGLS